MQNFEAVQMPENCGVRGFVRNDGSRVCSKRSSKTVATGGFANRGSSECRKSNNGSAGDKRAVQIRHPQTKPTARRQKCNNGSARGKPLLQIRHPRCSTLVSPRQPTSSPHQPAATKGRCVCKLCPTALSAHVVYTSSLSARSGCGVRARADRTCNNARATPSSTRAPSAEAR